MVIKIDRYLGIGQDLGGPSIISTAEAGVSNPPPPPPPPPPMSEENGGKKRDPITVVDEKGHTGDTGKLKLLDLRADHVDLGEWGIKKKKIIHNFYSRDHCTC